MVTTELSAELQALAAEWWEAFSRGDGEWFSRHVSRSAETRLAGTDTDDWLRGATANEALASVVTSLGGALEISAGVPEAFVAGDVGWVCSKPVISTPGGGLVEFRWSAVFRREDGDWRAVQVHASAAIPDEVLLARDH